MSILHSIYRAFSSLCSCVDKYVVERKLHSLGVGYAKRIPTHTSLKELHTLFSLACGCPANGLVLEIGSYLGASTCYLAAGIAGKNGKIFCVDTWLNETMQEGARDTFSEFSANTKPLEPWQVVIRKRSECLVEDDLATPLDLVFIDGDHSYQAVKADFEHVSCWLSLDGVIAFHDSLWHEGVSRVLGEALASGQWTIVGCVENLCWIKHAPDSWRDNAANGDSP